MSRPRLRASRPSASASIRPAAQSAVSSPKLWPATAVGPDAEVVEDAEDPQADRAEGRLRDLGGPQRGLVPCPLVVAERRVRIDQVAQAAAVVERDAVRLRQGGVHMGNRHARSRSMPTYCDPWPGKSIASAPAAGPLPTKMPSGALERPAATSAARLRHDPPQVGRLALDDQEEPAGIPGPEPRPRAGRLDPECLPRQVARPAVERREQGVGPIGREREDLHVAVPVDSRQGGLGLLEHAMEVAAAEAEGADRGAAGMVGRAAARGGARC